MLLQNRFIFFLGTILYVLRPTSSLMFRGHAGEKDDEPKPEINWDKYEYDHQENEINDFASRIQSISNLFESSFHRIIVRMSEFENRIDKLEHTIASVDSKIHNQISSYNELSKVQMTKLYNMINQTNSISKELLLNAQNLSRSSTMFSKSSRSSKRDINRNNKDGKKIMDTEIVEVENGQDNNDDASEDKVTELLISRIVQITLEKLQGKIINKINEEFSVLDHRVLEKLREIQQQITNNTLFSNFRDEQKLIKLNVDNMHVTVDEISSTIPDILNTMANLKAIVRGRSMELTIEKQFNHTQELLINLFQETHHNMTKLQLNCSQNIIQEKKVQEDPFITIGSLNSTFSPPLISLSKESSASQFKNPEDRSRSLSINEPKTKILQRPKLPSIKDFIKPEVGKYKPKFGIKKYSRHDKQCNGKTAGFPESCADIQKQKNGKCDRVYVISNGYKQQQVYCSDMDDYSNFTRGWMVILRRGKMNTRHFCVKHTPSCDLDFDRSLKDYIHGFGDMHSGEFFFGLSQIESYTNSEPHYLQIDLEDDKSNWVSFRYRNFKLGDFKSHYEFNIGKIEALSEKESNVAADEYHKLAQSLINLNGSIFIPPDSHPMAKPVKGCLEKFRSNWWMNRNMLYKADLESDRPVDCNTLSDVNLFAPLPGLYREHAYWNGWSSLDEHDRKIKSIIMKIRPMQLSTANTIRDHDDGSSFTKIKNYFKDFIHRKLSNKAQGYLG